MKLKKNPKVDLRRSSQLYFIIGLTLVLFLTWRLIEFRSYEKKYDYAALNVETEDQEDIPITELIKPPPPPPPPPPAPVEIEIIEDEEEIEETIIESTETDQEEVVEVEDVEVEDVEEEVTVPFTVIEDPPIFPGCERFAKKKAKLKKCFEERMKKHISSNFRYPDIAQDMGIQGRVFVNFSIDKDGSIVGVAVRGPDKSLEQEAKRIIGKLPKMTPGKQRGRPVRIQYSIPITFRLQ